MRISTRFSAAALAFAATVAFSSVMPSSGIAAEGETSTQATTAQTTESAGAPVSLKKFTKKRVRAARSTRKSAGKASLAQRAKAGKRAETYVSRKVTKPDADKLADATTSSSKLAPQVANASAFYNPGSGTSAAPIVTAPPNAETSTSEMMPANPSPDPVEVAEAAEVNDIDKAAWAPKDVPKLSPAILDSRAEMREEDSRWANTSTIGKIFVAIGALLTMGSAIRMFVA